MAQKRRRQKKILKVSGATIQNLRVNGSLPFTKIGDLYYYKKEDIDLMLSGPEKKPIETTGPAQKQTFNVNFYLRPSTASDKPESQIYIRISVNGQREEFSTQRQCLPQEWDNSSQRLLLFAFSDRVTTVKF